VPEGDSIFRAARTLHRALAGKVVTRFESVLPALTRVDHDAPLAGRTVDEVRAAGKHLLMRFSGDLVLRTHMRMNGSWHIYRPGERWQRRAGNMRIVVGTEDFVAVAFNVPVAQFLTMRALARQPDLRRLGPDLLAAGFDPAEATRRIRERPGQAIADVLLNQRVMAGAGNVYKSEVLFLCRINPFTPVAALTDAQLVEVVKTARRLLAANVSDAATGRIVTYPGMRRVTRPLGWGPSKGPQIPPSARQRPGQPAAVRDVPTCVYGRAGLPCRECGTLITRRAQGPNARLTYWCPRCQP
jgi:endonuclease VIII